MCGFTGIAWTDPQLAHGAEQRVARMARTIHHRGPDSDGRIAASFAEVAFKRLSIVDLAGGHQPLANEDGTIEVLLNGEIYNHRELRAALEKRGHLFHTTSDTEVLPHLYEEYGDAFLEQLNGMFAICLVDHVRGRLLLARDRLGIKPMYVAEQPGGLVFGSELKALLASDLVERALDPGAVLPLLNSFSLPGRSTLVPGIERLLPGESAVFEGGALQRRRWWTPPLPRATCAPDRDELEALLEDAVALRLVADVPVGISLSGGLDSSLLTLVAARRETSDLKLFTVHFEGTPHDEAQCAREIATRFGLQHELLSATTSDFADDAARMTWFNDEPVADPAYYAAMKVAETAAEHVTVLLAGTGADELFAGYGRYALTRKRAWLAAMPGPLRAALPRIAPGDAHELAALASYADSRLDWHVRCMSHLTPADVQTLCAHLPASADPRAALTAAFAAASHRHPLDQQLYADTVTYLPDQLLVLQDRTTMGASIEGRVPFLDHRLVEAAFRIGGEHKLGAGRGYKALLRRIARGHIPDVILDRKKLGFPNAVEEWLGGELGELLPALFAAPDSFAAQYLPGAWLARLSATPDSRRAHWRTLYPVLCLQLWHKLFITDAASAPPSGSLHDLFGLSERRNDRRRA